MWSVRADQARPLGIHGSRPCSPVLRSRGGADLAIDGPQFSVDAQGQATLDARWGILTISDEQPRIRAALLTRPVGDPGPGGRATALRETVAAQGEKIAANCSGLRGGGS